MCLLIALSRVVPDTPLVLAGNRDERFDRAATPMAVLRDSAPRVLGGRDLVAGGTWLAVNDAGVVAGLTNCPSATGPDASRRSRGELPLALTTHPTAAGAVKALVEDVDPGDYNPAWLLVGDRETLFSVDLTGAAVTVRELPPGVHVLENRPMEGGSPKAERVRELLGDVTGSSAADVVARLALAVADHRLPERMPEGVEPRRPGLDAACVHTEQFGTRWSGVVTVGADPDVAPGFRHTDGPPCRAPFTDASALWG